MIKVIITDDHPMITNGLKNILQDAGNIEVTAIYDSASSLMADIQNLDADVLILDIQFSDGNGYDVAVAVRNAKPNIGILIFTSTDTVYQVKRMQQAGCLGYLLKNADNKTIFKAIGAVSEGYRFLSSELEKALMDDMFATKKEKKKNASLTKRELEILTLIAKEYTNQEIAAELFLANSTIEFHRANLLEKLGVKNTAGLVRMAFQFGLV